MGVCLHTSGILVNGRRGGDLKIKLKSDWPEGFREGGMAIPAMRAIQDSQGPGEAGTGKGWTL